MVHVVGVGNTHGASDLFEFQRVDLPSPSATSGSAQPPTVGPAVQIGNAPGFTFAKKEEGEGPSPQALPETDQEAVDGLWDATTTHWWFFGTEVHVDGGSDVGKLKDIFSAGTAEDNQRYAELYELKHAEDLEGKDLRQVLETAGKAHRAELLFVFDHGKAGKEALDAAWDVHKEIGKIDLFVDETYILNRIEDLTPEARELFQGAYEASANSSDGTQFLEDIVHEGEFTESESARAHSLVA